MEHEASRCVAGKYREMGADNCSSSAVETSKSAQGLNGDGEEFDKELAKNNNNNGRWEEEASDWDTKKQAEWSAAPAKTFQPPLSQELQLQLDAARGFKVLFFAGREDESGHFSSDSEEEEEEEEEEEGEREEEEQGVGGGSAALADRENEVRSYFESALNENEELRRFYVENCKRGPFQCAVCAATNGKVWRIYPNCAGLIQHSMTVLHTKSKAAHRGYGRAICGLLGWDSDKFLGLLRIKKLKSLNLSSKGEESDKETDSSSEMTAFGENDAQENPKNIEEENPPSPKRSEESISK